MNKKLVLILTLIVSFIVSISSVNAAQELTCNYKKGASIIGGQKLFKVTQSTNGTLKFYYGSDFEDITSDILGNKGTLENNEGQTNTGFDEKTKTLSYCPPCANKDNKTVQFSNPKSDGTCPNSFTALERDENNKDWKKICYYRLC